MRWDGVIKERRDEEREVAASSGNRFTNASTPCSHTPSHTYHINICCQKRHTVYQFHSHTRLNILNVKFISVELRLYSGNKMQDIRFLQQTTCKLNKINYIINVSLLYCTIW